MCYGSGCLLHQRLAESWAATDRQRELKQMAVVLQRACINNMFDSALIAA